MSPVDHFGHDLLCKMPIRCVDRVQNCRVVPTAEHASDLVKRQIGHLADAIHRSPAGFDICPGSKVSDEWGAKDALALDDPVDHLIGDVFLFFHLHSSG